MPDTTASDTTASDTSTDDTSSVTLDDEQLAQLTEAVTTEIAGYLTSTPFVAVPVEVTVTVPDPATGGPEEPGEPEDPTEATAPVGSGGPPSSDTGTDPTAPVEV
ncbi:hypothetical protein ABZ848_13675 [Streptomyces sp. NPDC047081]|uniref:hypothetical protein n=1 Tax=Streptomyces sp. NPDC047081 TaxID=3154706 RepID=UPI0033C868AC